MPVVNEARSEDAWKQAGKGRLRNWRPATRIRSVELKPYWELPRLFTPAVSVGTPGWARKKS